MKYIILSIILLLSLTGLVFGYIAKIETVSCIGNYESCGEYLQGELSGIRGKQLVVAKKSAKDILESISWIRKYSINYKFPRVLAITIVEKEPFAAIKDKKGLYAIVDKEGEILKFSDKTLLPVINVSENSLDVGEKISIDALFAIQLLVKLKSLYDVKASSLENNSMVAEVGGIYKIIFPLAGDMENIILSLESIVSRLNNTEQLTKIEVDLRFRNPVIKNYE